MHRYFEINEAGHNVRCKLYCHDIKNIRRLVLFTTGFGGHKDNSAAEKLANRLISKYKDCAMITFNWPGHGDDVKKGLHLADCNAYLELVIAHIRRKFQTDDICACATSFGGYMTLKYIFEQGNPFRKIVLRCPAVNMYDVLTAAIMTGGEYEKLQRKKEIPVGFDRKIMVGLPLLEDLKANDIQTWDYLDYAEDILILQGTADEIVPYEAVHAFAENNLIEFVPIQGADHRFRDEKKMEQTIKLTLDFFEL